MHNSTTLQHAGVDQAAHAGNGPSAASMAWRGVDLSITGAEAATVGHLDLLALALVMVLLEVLYRSFGVLIPHLIKASELRLSGEQQAKLCSCGPSYAVSTVVTSVLAVRGLCATVALYGADPVHQHCMTPGLASQWARPQGDVAFINQVFLAYMLYDVLHVVAAYPALGKLDTVAHHAGFAFAAIINGYYAMMPWAGAWLMAGELSTLPLNTRWFLIHTGRGESRAMSISNKAFASLFFSTRIILYGGGLFWLVRTRDALFRPQAGTTCADAPSGFKWVVVALIALGYCLNVQWMGKILYMAAGGERVRKKVA